MRDIVETEMKTSQTGIFWEKKKILPTESPFRATSMMETMTTFKKKALEK